MLYWPLALASDLVGF